MLEIIEITDDPGQLNLYLERVGDNVELIADDGKCRQTVAVIHSSHTISLIANSLIKNFQ